MIINHERLAKRREGFTVFCNCGRLLNAEPNAAEWVDHAEYDYVARYTCACGLTSDFVFGVYSAPVPLEGTK